MKGCFISFKWEILPLDLYNLMDFLFLSLFSRVFFSASSRERLFFLEKRRLRRNFESIYKFTLISLNLLQKNDYSTYTNGRLVAFTLCALNSVLVSLLVLVVIRMILWLGHFRWFLENNCEIARLIFHFYNFWS